MVVASGRLAPAKWWCWEWPENTITIPTRSSLPTINRTRRTRTYAPVWAKPSTTCCGFAGRCGPWRWITPSTPFLRRLWYFPVRSLLLRPLVARSSKDSCQFVPSSIYFPQHSAGLRFCKSVFSVDRKFFGRYGQIFHAFRTHRRPTNCRYPQYRFTESRLGAVEILGKTNQI